MLLNKIIRKLKYLKKKELYKKILEKFDII